MKKILSLSLLLLGITSCTTLNIVDEITTPLPNTTPQKTDYSQPKIEVPQDYQQQQMMLRKREKEKWGW